MDNSIRYQPKKEEENGEINCKFKEAKQALLVA